MIQTFLILLGLCGLFSDSQVGGRVSPDGSEALACDLPAFEHMKNTGGSDGAGLCVFTSVEHCARWQNEGALRGFQQKMRKEPGGGYPEKLDRMMARHCPGATCLQYTGNDPALLKIALRTGRMPAVTYGFSPRYGSRIAHMVNLVHFSDRWACILDNNFPGDDKYEWMKPVEFERRWTMGGGGWAVFLLNPPPPPIPISLQPRMVEFSFDEAAPAQDATDDSGDTKPDSKIENFGIEQERLGGGECYRLNGVALSGEQAGRILGNPSVLPDDSQLGRITLIGTREDRSRVENDLLNHPSLAAYRGRYLLQSYMPGDWAVKDAGFDVAGSPRIVIQHAPDAGGMGRVLHSQGDYGDGAEGLANALRRADPNYDPARDVDLRKTGPLKMPDWAGNWLVFGIAILSLLAGRFSMPVLGLLAAFLKTLVPARKSAPDLDTLLDQLLKRMNERK